MHDARSRSTLPVSHESLHRKRATS